MRLDKSRSNVYVTTSACLCHVHAYAHYIVKNRVVRSGQEWMKSGRLYQLCLVCHFMKKNSMDENTFTLHVQFWSQAVYKLSYKPYLLQ